MDLIDKLRELAARIPKQLESIKTEEATKHAIVMPLIAALGYNVFDPTEVTPELTADVGLKKGEKVDYAILKDGNPIILFECKHHEADLSQAHLSQLYRYFNATKARFGVLTNGFLYWFYTDLEAPNKMDEKPFFEFNLLDIRENAVEELKKFSKSTFDLDYILNTAAGLKYSKEIKRLLLEQMQEPTEDFVRFFASKIYAGRMTQTVKDQFSQLVKQALKSFISDQVNDRLKTALATDVTEQTQAPGEPSSIGEQITDSKTAAETTEEEIEGYHIIKAILWETVDPKRITLKDSQSYCAILLDNNNRKPICRLRFNSSQKAVSLFNTGTEERVKIEGLNDIYQLAERLKATVARYDEKISADKKTPKQAETE